MAYDAIQAARQDIDRHAYDEAIAKLRAVVQQDASNAPAHRYLGLALASKGEHDEAEHYLGRAAQLAPDDADVHYDLGTHYARLSRPDDARRHLTRALELQPDRADARAALVGLQPSRPMAAPPTVTPPPSVVRSVPTTVAQPPQAEGAPPPPRSGRPGPGRDAADTGRTGGHRDAVPDGLVLRWKELPREALDLLKPDVRGWYITNLKIAALTYLPVQIGSFLIGGLGVLAVVALVALAVIGVTSIPEDTRDGLVREAERWLQSPENIEELLNSEWPRRLELAGKIVHALLFGLVTIPLELLLTAVAVWLWLGTELMAIRKLFTGHLDTSLLWRGRLLLTRRALVLFGLGLLVELVLLVAGRVSAWLEPAFGVALGFAGLFLIFVGPLVLLGGRDVVQAVRESSRKVGSDWPRLLWVLLVLSLIMLPFVLALTVPGAVCACVGVFTFAAVLTGGTWFGFAHLLCYRDNFGEDGFRHLRRDPTLARVVFGEGHASGGPATGAS